MSSPLNPPLSQETINQFVMAAHFDLAKVQQMLVTQPALLNENADWLETPIQAAAHTGSSAIAEYLIEQGAPIDICTAAMLGQTQTVAELLSAHPELALATGAHNIPVLFFPMIHGHRLIAEMLLNAGALVNVPDGGNSPLHGAARFGQTELVRWLLEHDANPFAIDFDGKTPYDRAVQHNHAGAAALLKPYADAEDGAFVEGTATNGTASDGTATEQPS